MRGLGELKNVQIIILGLCIAGATIISTSIMTKGVLQIKKFTNEVIRVTGSAEKKIISDYIVWNASFSRRDPDLQTAYKELQEDLKKVKKYLISKGVKENEIEIYSVDIRKLYKLDEKGHTTNQIEKYVLYQKLEVKSYDVKKIDEISKKSTELINQGIQFISEAPKYFYTKLADLKVEMLSKATENARKRAECMANSAGNKIGTIRSAKMGVFQITPVTSTEVSWYGQNDTSSMEKKVMAVVSATFSIKE